MALSSPESEGEREDVDEGVDLEDTEEEDAEVLKGLREEIPEETNVRGEVGNCEAVREEGECVSVCSHCSRRRQFVSSTSQNWSKRIPYLFVIL